jgi:hypothetical protein
MGRAVADPPRRRRRDEDDDKPKRPTTESNRGRKPAPPRKGRPPQARRPSGDARRGGGTESRGRSDRGRSGSPERGRSGPTERGRYEQPRHKRKDGASGRGRPDRAGGGDRRGRSQGPPSGRGRPERGTHKRTSKSSDDRNPTRSSVDYPAPKYRTKGEPEAAPAKPARPSLRKVRGKPEAPKRPTKERQPRKKATARRRPIRTTEATEELRQIAGRRANTAVRELSRAADAVSAGHDRDAMRILRPLRDQYPDAAAIRELLGLCHYRIGQYPAAAKELGAFADLTGSVEQHPVLMDCARAQKKWAKVSELWDELAAASPSAALVAEGRIVMAGSLADRGRLRDAIALLERRGGNVKRPAEHQLRVWYVLADLSERAGDLPRARELFDRIRRADPSFADVAERLLTLG